MTLYIYIYIYIQESNIETIILMLIDGDVHVRLGQTLIVKVIVMMILSRMINRLY